MSGQNSHNQNERNPGNDESAQGAPHQMNQRGSAFSSSLFNPNYRGPQTSMNASGMANQAQPYNTPVYNQAPVYGRGYPTGRGGYQGRSAPMPPYSHSPNPPPPGHHQPGFAVQPHRPPSSQQHPGSAASHPGPARFPSPTPRHQPGLPPARPPPATSLPSRSTHAARPAAAGRGTRSSSKPFGEDDFPSLGSQPQRQPQQARHRQQLDAEAELSARMASYSIEDQPKGGAGGRGGSGGRPKFVPFTDYDVSSAAPQETGQQKPSSNVLPPPRTRRNEAFRLHISDCYRGKIIFIDELSGIDYSNHPAIVRSIDHATKQIRFFKKSSFKGIGGFLNKYGEYVNQSQKRWHEKQWLLVDDGVTKPHHGTPLLKLANGEKMPERGSYVDIHGESELHIDYFSKYSRYGVFPDIYLPEDQMRQLEEYSEWYLEKDEEYRAAEERKKRQRWQMDGSADVDVGDVYEDSENEADGE
ncbi:uncharacterized protein LTHEOB_9332 [Lasiodiplodia theobromae]|uniref:uncharacterized protein n=1 Tax=Lasiodiplodia theobromae TaxID=45133 RepID=UPI0015C3276F|nr:uncharacterized protein LTHEOB_9332 [Lasiodiplodia theobromae]KAF4540236.1 hypothetical protein LTHEOB_9332 [Lasiodiplodia theobromae]